jgi:hypothetical protein
MIIETNPPKPGQRFNIGDNASLALVILASLATCAVCETQDARETVACYEAGYSPEECD